MNDHLHIESKLQCDLNTVILRWRLHKYVCTADVEKIYRQIWVDPRDTVYQCILWRCESTPCTHRLRTVTYGTASAPFLALRVLKQLATDEEERYSLESKILLNEFYVLFGSDSITELDAKRSNLEALMRSREFRLHKCATNDRTSLPNSRVELELKADDNVKLLGLSWNPTRDCFQFRLVSQDVSNVTKRQVLSIIARLYHPLGWLAPVIVLAKTFMQEL